MYVIMELCNLLQGMFINEDIEMYHPDTDTPARARSSNLCQELGQVQYIFSDKTGTLTRNVMEFKMASINHTSYGELSEADGFVKVRREDQRG